MEYVFVACQDTKKNSESLSHLISLIFNNIPLTGHYPVALKIPSVTALFKTGDKLDPNNHRPISSIPLLNKMF